MTKPPEKSKVVRKLRCAVYTRKSSEEGLEQEFNSLHAQREACEAYIASQRSEGWVLVRDQYDDGGISGGTLERPGLKRLLEDIEDGLVDVVVVYKIDRLSRSLADFAKLVEVFDRNGVTFVSVTQSFNTTTSMGRLTLNILLSFAQFEREVTAERIRDKVAASRKKGMWMGGVPPYGYRVENRKLVVDEDSATHVRWIFDRFLEIGSCTELAREVGARGIRTPRGNRIDKKYIYRMLSNRAYIGEAVHKGDSYPGEHDAIIDRETWDKVHAILTESPRKRAARTRADTPALLKGLLFGPDGAAFSPTHTRKGDRLYRYYVSQTVLKHGAGSCPVGRVPAGEIEAAVIDQLRAVFRGSAAEDSAWREILTHFSGATQIGLTATPKETEYVSNTEYFGEPVFTYSLKQGISDGFLAPYKVIKVHIDRDVEGYRPEKGQLDRDGNEVEDRIYNAKDFDRTLVLDDRTLLIAKKITAFLKESGDRYQKTIVFCVDQEHAARMRQALINENSDLVTENARYVMRITGSDKEGQDQLGNFIDPESKWPVLVTTSRLLSTGVDAQTCRLIVLDREIGSMTEFKQIVGRGTRVHEDTRKFYFTLIDFRGATAHFADPDFDGDPVQIYAPGADDPMTPPDEEPATPEGEDAIPPTPGEDETIVDQPGLPLPTGDPVRKIYVDGVGARIIAERVEYLDENGKLVTESLRDFTKNALRKRFASLDEFLKRWNSTERKQAIVEELEAEGLALDAIADELGKNLDPFDLICHVAFDAKPLTRRERAEHVKKRDVFTKYGPQARAVLDALLEKYRDEGVLNLDDANVLKVTPFTDMGSVVQLINAFGGKAGFEKAVHELQDALYQETA